MSLSARRTVWYVVLSVLMVAVGALGFWAYSMHRITQLAGVTVAEEPSALVWSADGSYIAVATTKKLHFGGMEGPGHVSIIDVAKQVVTATLDTVGGVNSLAFSPDGKWLAVTSVHQRDKEESELVVFTVPEFKAKFTAKAKFTYELANNTRKSWFFDLAWAPDGKSLFAVDAGLAFEPARAIRRWSFPEFIEQPAISFSSGLLIPEKLGLAVAPDGISVALACGGNLKLLHVEKGTETWSTRVPEGYTRIGFATDGKHVGVFSGSSSLFPFGLNLEGKGKAEAKPGPFSWWDVSTGKWSPSTKAQFAVMPPGQMASRFYTIAPNTRTWVGAPFGQAPLRFTQTDPPRTWVLEAEAAPMPALAFSADSTKLAGVLKSADRWIIAIWAMP